MKKRFSEERIVWILNEAESGVPITELCRKHNISDATFYMWRTKYRGMSALEVSKLKILRDENQRLKKLLAEALLENAALKDGLSRKW